MLLSPVIIRSFTLLFTASSIILCLSPTIKISFLLSGKFSINVVLLKATAVTFPLISLSNLNTALPSRVFKILSYDVYIFSLSLLKASFNMILAVIMSLNLFDVSTIGTPVILFLSI